eukprot:TRINITY_DN368_c0_g1_i2.p1 TRINITY_DN368_c0_g1~~TRINITY_DN368_c0_g1_i2.p1  ORF type:complete len:857 (-),score=174.43 TRINITY_DN368_c0_g1_i2:15-2585(-)
MKERKGNFSKKVLYLVLGLVFVSLTLSQANFARLFNNFLTVSDQNINLKLAFPLVLGAQRTRLYDDSGVLRGYQSYDPNTKVGVVTLVYPPLADYAQKSQVQALLAEERRMLPALRSIYSLASEEIVRTVRTWNNMTARVGRYRATGRDSGSVFVNDVTQAVASVVSPSLALNTFATTPSERIGDLFSVRTMFELRYYNGTNNGTLGRGNATADVVFSIAVLPNSVRTNETSRFVWRDYTDSSAVAEWKDVAQNDTMYVSIGQDPMIDIVMIVDNSYSMDDHQRSTSNAANVLRSSLANTGFNNFRVALLSSSFYNPQCWALGNGLCDQTRNTSCRPFVAKSRLASLGAWLTANTSSWIGAGNTVCQTGTEKALLSLQEITTPNVGHATFMPPSTNNEQKFRRGSNLVFIFVGDADDQSYGVGNPDSKGTCMQGINAYTQYLRNLRANNGFNSITLGGILCPSNVQCAETQCTPRIIRSVINRFSGFIGDITTQKDVSDGMGEIMRDVVAAASNYRLRYRAISTSVQVSYPRTGLTVGNCPQRVPRSLINGFDYDVQRNAVVLYGSCRPVNVTGNQTIQITYSYWSPRVNCSLYRNSIDCSPSQCRWCPGANGTRQTQGVGTCVNRQSACPLIVAPPAGVFGGYGQGANGGYTAAGARGIPWWAILLLILFLCCLCLLCLLLLLLLFLLFKPSKTTKSSNKRIEYQMMDNPGSKSGSYAPPADDYGAEPYSGSGAGYDGDSGSGYAGDDYTGDAAGAGSRSRGNTASGTAGSGYAADDYGSDPYGSDPYSGAPAGGYAGGPSGSAAGSGDTGRPPLRGGGRPMTLDSNLTPGEQGDPNVKPTDNKYITTGAKPVWF